MYEILALLMSEVVLQPDDLFKVEKKWKGENFMFPIVYTVVANLEENDGLQNHCFQVQERFLFLRFQIGISASSCFDFIMP